jgi:hypothetical protein
VTRRAPAKASYSLGCFIEPLRRHQAGTLLAQNDRTGEFVEREQVGDTALFAFSTQAVSSRRTPYDAFLSLIVFVSHRDVWLMVLPFSLKLGAGDDFARAPTHQTRWSFRVARLN